MNELWPRGEYDIPLILQDRAFTRDGEFDYDHHGHRGAAGTVMLVNGAAWTKDTVAIDDGEDVDVSIRWSGYRGRYLLHCHNLEHEDHSMMARVDVIDG